MKLGPQQARVFRKLAAPEILGEMILLALVGAFGVYFLLDMLSWPLAAKLLPTMALAVGAPFWVARLVILIRHALVESGSAEYVGMRTADKETSVMDMGFYLDEKTRGAARRFIMVCASIIGLMLSIWLFGWHVAVPVWVSLYLWIAGKLKWWGAALGGLGILAFIVIMFDVATPTIWNEPLIISFLEWLVGGS